MWQYHNRPKQQKKKWQQVETESALSVRAKIYSRERERETVAKVVNRIQRIQLEGKELNVINYILMKHDHVEIRDITQENQPRCHQSVCTMVNVLLPRCGSNRASSSRYGSGSVPAVCVSY